MTVQGAQECAKNAAARMDDAGAELIQALEELLHEREQGSTARRLTEIILTLNSVHDTLEAIDWSGDSRCDARRTRIKLDDKARTVNEIAAMSGLKPGSVYQQLKRMEAAGRAVKVQGWPARYRLPEKKEAEE